MSLLLRINVVRAIKSSRMRWSDHVAHTREKIHAQFRLGNLMERYHFEIYCTGRNIVVESGLD